MAIKKLVDCEWEILESTNHKGLFMVWTESDNGMIAMRDSPFYFESTKSAISFCRRNGFRYKVVKP